jgi:peptidoglycan/LPS O-acetylase OafA/YrhL
LDGIRGLAILFVLVGHMHERIAPLAAAGVTLFFVLSGYLITGILLAEYRRHSRIVLRRFYLRRLSRLAPPSIVMLAVMAPVLGSSWEQWLPAAAWFANYAGHLGVDVEPFGHTWSLAVEEQFYLVWPVALLCLLRLGRRAPSVLLAIMLLLLSWRLLLTANGHLDYAYSALETAGAPIVGGCLVALAGWRLPKAWAACGLFSTLALVALASVVDARLWLVMPMLVLPTVVTVVAAAENASWLACRPLVLCGAASYSLYLWHKPVAWAVDGGLTLEGVVAGTLVGLAAYWVVEAPLMRWRAQRTGQLATPAPASLMVPLQGPQSLAEGSRPSTPVTSNP